MEEWAVYCFCFPLTVGVAGKSFPLTVGVAVKNVMGLVYFFSNYHFNSHKPYI